MTEYLHAHLISCQSANICFVYWSNVKYVTKLLFLLAAVAAAVCLFVCLFVCVFVCSLFPFAKLVLFRFLSWFNISLICSICIHFFLCTLVLGSTNIFYHISVKLSVSSLFT